MTRQDLEEQLAEELEWCRRNQHGSSASRRGLARLCRAYLEQHDASTADTHPSLPPVVLPPAALPPVPSSLIGFDPKGAHLT